MLRRTFARFDTRAHILPKRFFLVRHGESLANLDKAVYSHTPDWVIPLAPKGHEQALCAGRKLRERIQNEPVSFFVSPYRRAQETLEGIVTCFDDHQIVGVTEDERLREQEMGNYQPLDKMKATWDERNEQGRFFYRFPDGENGADVCDRVSSFLDCFFREREEDSCRRWIQNDNVVIVFHGLMMRLFIARWFKLPLEYFDGLYNPPNCAIIEMVRDDETGKMSMTKESLALLGWREEGVPLVTFDGTDITRYYLNTLNHLPADRCSEHSTAATTGHPDGAGAAAAAAAASASAAASDGGSATSAAGSTSTANSATPAAPA